MLPFTNYSRQNQQLNEKMSSCIRATILMFRIFGYMLFFFGWIELGGNTFKKHQCYVNSTKLIKVDGTVRFQWNVTVLDKNRKIDKVLITSILKPEEESRLIETQKFKINQTYSCYGPSKSLFRLPWQWNRPSMSKGYHLFFFGVLLIIAAILLEKLKRYGEPELTDTQQQQSRTLLSTQNGQQSIAATQNPPQERALSEGPPPEWTPSPNLSLERSYSEILPPEIPPPIYEVAVQELLEKQARV